jgi:hypothetical protein
MHFPDGGAPVLRRGPWKTAVLPGVEVFIIHRQLPDDLYLLPPQGFNVVNSQVWVACGARGTESSRPPRCFSVTGYTAGHPAWDDSQAPGWQALRRNRCQCDSRRYWERSTCSCRSQYSETSPGPDCPCLPRNKGRQSPHRDCPPPGPANGLAKLAWFDEVSPPFLVLLLPLEVCERWGNCDSRFWKSAAASSFVGANPGSGSWPFRKSR